MIQDIKALIVVLGLTLPLWMLARRLFAPFSSIATFDRRRNAWIALTIAGFLAPSIWIYALIAVPILAWCGSRDENPAALCLTLMFVVPPVSVQIPTIGINQLFEVNHFRLLMMVVLLPAALRVRRAEPQRRRGLDAMDALVLAYMVLVLVLFMPYESITNSMRRLFLFGLDTLLVYYVFSRLGPTRASVRECMAAWLLAGLLLAPVALFETGRMWLLYTGISDRWGDPNVFAWLLRGNALRAQAAAGHSLALGYFLAMAWGFFLFIQRHWHARWPRYALGALLLGGLWATLSRGPWLTAALFTLVYLALDPKGAVVAVKAMAGLAIASLLLLASPLGDGIVAYLPFVGNVDASNVEYRVRLFETSLTLIGQNPFFGNPFVLEQMESLRQGQGIIDLINGYVQIALFYGLVGLGLFVLLLVLGAKRGFTAWRAVRYVDAEAARSIAALVAAMLSTMFFIATAGYGWTTYMIAGMLASYWHIVVRKAPANARAAPSWPAARAQGRRRTPGRPVA